MYELFRVLMGLLLIFTSVFMILLILVQRGRGGGLTGALGGAGGQSAFGSKAGDVFTRITIGTAVVWIFLTMLTISIYNQPPAPPSKAASGDETNLSDTSTGEGDASGEGDAASGEKLPGDTLLPGESETPADPKTGTDPAKSSTEAKPGDPGLNAPATSNDSGAPPVTPPVEPPKKDDGATDK